LEIALYCLAVWLVIELLAYAICRRRVALGLSIPRFLPGLCASLARRLQQRESTQRRRTQRLLLQLKSMRELERSVPDAMLAIDQHHMIVWHNRNASSLLGVRVPRALRGKVHLAQALPDARLQTWLEHDSSQALFGVPAATSPDIRLSFRIVAMPNQLRLLIARDATQLLRLEQVRRDFVANVSHELRTPLTVLHGYLDTLEPEELPEYATMLTEMRTQNSRMIRIVEDLLILARLENAEAIGRGHAGRVNIQALLRQLQRDAQALSQDKHEIVLVDALNMDLQGDEKDLRSAFQNLVSNAVRYTPSGGRVEIRWEAHADGAQFCVRDSGIGIPKQHLPRLTERFYRVSSSRSRDSGGTGLGLAIVNHVLSAHFGRLAIDSEVGKGSSFACVFRHEALIPRSTQ
jgi:two-component system, OmpR family, phosphate regulon sensor histidine kinase PhoR